MGFTQPNFNLEAEVALFLGDEQSDLNFKEGDIMVSRRPIGGVGSKEVERFLWLMIDGLEENDLFALSIPIFDELGDNITEKARYRISLSDLSLRDVNFDIDAARDPNVTYQPYLIPDLEDFIFVENSEVPFDAQGLAWDKELGFYL